VSEQFTFDDLKRILVESLGTPEDEVPSDLDTTFHELGFDSIDFAEIQASVEARHGIQVTEEDAQRITTLRDAIEYTNQRLLNKR
jgi:acyl carrier protein